MAEPRKLGFETDIWTGKILVEYSRRKCGITFVSRTMQTLMHEMGSGTSSLGRGTSKPLSSRRKRRLKKDSQLATYYSNRGYKILAGDEASSILGWNVQKGRHHRDAKAISPTTPSNKRPYLMGCWATAPCTTGYTARQTRKTTWISCGTRTNSMTGSHIHGQFVDPQVQGAD